MSPYLQSERCVPEVRRPRSTAGSAGSVYTPGTARDCGEQKLYGYSGGREYRRTALLRSNSGSGNAAAGSAPGGSTTTTTSSDPWIFPRLKCSGYVGCKLRYEPADGNLNSALAHHQLQPRAATTTGSNNSYTNTGSMTGPGSSNTNYNYSSGSSSTAAQEVGVLPPHHRI